MLGQLSVNLLTRTSICCQSWQGLGLNICKFIDSVGSASLILLKTTHLKLEVNILVPKRTTI